MPSKYKTLFKAASIYGFWGMLASFIWLLFSLFVLSFFKSAAFEEPIRGINAPLVYQVSERFFHSLCKLGLVNKHDAITFFLIIFLVYLIVGYLLGFFFYFICQMFWKIKGCFWGAK
jgi:hypothetical protein